MKRKVVMITITKEHQFIRCPWPLYKGIFAFDMIAHKTTIDEVDGFIQRSINETQDLHCWAANQQICVATGSTGSNTEQLKGQWLTGMTGSNKLRRSRSLVESVVQEAAWTIDNLVHMMELVVVELWRSSGSGTSTQFVHILKLEEEILLLPIVLTSAGTFVVVVVVVVLLLHQQQQRGAWHNNNNYASSLSVTKTAVLQ